MSLGFQQAFKAGISFGKDDMVIPDNKWTIVGEARTRSRTSNSSTMDGLITQGEKYNKVVDAWSKCTDHVTEAMMERISTQTMRGAKEIELGLHDGHSGARGSITQMRQLAAMRGLMAKPTATSSKRRSSRTLRKA